MGDLENKILDEISRLEKESEKLLEGIDMNNMTEEEAEKVSNVLDEMFIKIKNIMEESNKINDQIEEINTEIE